MSRLAPLLAAALLVSCGAEVVVDPGPASGDPDASIEPVDAGVDAADGGPVVLAPCHCLSAPDHEICVDPMECCPTVGACKDPASFNCSGSAKPCP